MKVRVLKEFETAKGKLVKGQIIDVKPDVYRQWQKEGKVCYKKEEVK
jgi:hypothetical protein